MEHSGVVTAVGEGRVDVLMHVESACASCKARSACMMSDSSDKTVTVETPAAEMFSVGERVVVAVEQVMGVKAVMLAYVYPFFAMFAALLGMFALGAGETAAGLTSLGVLASYYIVLWFFRNRIKKEIIFNIKKA